MATQKDEPDRGFTVIDRRGGGRDEAPPAPASAAPAPPEEPAAEPAKHALPIDFTSFVLSLATSALFHMGFVGDPEHDEPMPEPNLPLARQTIDTLAMLQLKTTGNLDAEEAHLVEGVLYELRLRFVEASK